ncbi:Ig-like domain-containing protein [Clostridium weizhouense]|uniref:Ig-like domain-containing protein n=1 Tax=Clostridium weizhouense TaxID=2859781 RepID=A0ABS7ATI3_9CLOT|nr:Ig-like domain-containing protein [Clostridium weizhouense]MBW6411859.1 Ig-like domain-containing protein [Clostridium weizhouense]
MKNYFKKILIMFVMVLTIMGIGVISNCYVANAATVGEQLLQPEDGWKRYEDDNSKIFYYGEIGEAKNENLSGGSAHQTGYNGYSEIKFNFTKNKIALIYRAYNYGKNPTISIDGNAPEEIKANNYDGLSILVYKNDSLEDKEHTVVIKTYTSHVFDSIDIDKDGILLAYNEDIKNQLISLDKSSLNLKEGNLKQLKATTTPTGAKVVWSSSDESIAKVDENGNVTGVKEGQATITAQIKDSEIKATCTVTVTKASDTNTGNTTPTNPTDNSGGTSTGTEEPTNIVNIAHAKGDNTNNASGQVSIIFKGVAEAQLKVVKTADVDSVYVGDTFTYTIEVTNTSDKVAKSVVINDNAPNHIDFIVSGVTTTQGKVDSSSTSKNIVVNVGDIQPSGKVTIKIPANVVL